MDKDLFLKLYGRGIFNFDFFYNSNVCSIELCKFYNDINLTRVKNFNKIDALYDLVNIYCSLNMLFDNKISSNDTINYLENYIKNLLKKYK